MRRPKVSERLPNDLTPRQREILTLWDAGMRPADIARKLGISRVTVHQHLRYAKAKAVKRHLAQAIPEPVLAGG